MAPCINPGLVGVPISSDKIAFSTYIYIYICGAYLGAYQK